MKREEKKQAVADLHEKFSRSTVAILMEFRGLDMTEMTELRRKLRSVKGELRVVKNTLARRAAEGTGMAGSREAFKGPIAVTFGFDDPVSPMKVLGEFIDKRAEKVKVKLGIVEGRVMDAGTLKVLASLPKKEILISNLIGRLKGPMTGLIWGLNGLLRNLVVVLDAVGEKKSSGKSSSP